LAFLLRTISFSAEGREIVRTTRIDDDLLKAGRDPDCDIRLNDLAVALHHATLEIVSADRIGISAEMGMTVEIDGHTAKDGRIDLAIGGTIKIGPFVLRILAREMGSEDVAIDIRRADAEAEDDRFDTRRFALQTVMPGKRATAWSLAAAVLLLFLAWPIWSFYQSRTEAARYAQGYHADRLWLSGSLSQGHAGLAQNCQACHVEPFVAVRDQACTACHTRIHDHADLARMQRANPNLSGFRRLEQSIGALFGLDPGRCVDCHTEHEGPSRIPPTPQRFCADCHADIRARLPDARLGSAADFERDHPEFQPAVLIQWSGDAPVVQRIALDRRPLEMSNLKFPHALHLDPRGGAAQMGRRLSARHGFGQRLECADCHVPTPDGTRFQPPDMEDDCGMCHSLAFDQLGGTIRTLRHGSPEQVIGDIRSLYRAGGPQRPATLATERSRPGDVMQVRAALQVARARAGTGGRAERAIRAVFSQGGACFDCHVVQQPAPGTLDYRIRPVAFPVRYMLHGWFDHRAHQIVQRPGQPRLDGSAACLGCHRADASSNAADLLLPDLDSCRVCHGGESTGLPVASTCAMCHDYHMDEGTPAELLRQRVRGRRWETTVIPVQPRPAARGR
jgi:cytochrome c3-like protein